MVLITVSLNLAAISTVFATDTNSIATSTSKTEVGTLGDIVWRW